MTGVAGSPLSDADVEALAKVLATHRLHPSMNICTGCSWSATANAGSLLDQHEAHRAQHLAALVAQHRAEVVERVEAVLPILDHFEGAVQMSERYGEGFYDGLAHAAGLLRAALAVPTPTPSTEARCNSPLAQTWGSTSNAVVGATCQLPVNHRGPHLFSHNHTSTEA